jgi:hypothetical protein
MPFRPLFLLFLAAALATPAASAGGDRPQQKEAPPGLAKKGGVPPGLAKKGGLPPGLAKKFGAKVPEHPYIAFDPDRTDRAWFLVEGRWVLKEGFTSSLRLEVQDSLKRPPVPPPVPVPRVGIELHVVLFE